MNQGKFKFKHSFIDKGMSVDTYNKSLLADLDNDGVLEYITGEHSFEEPRYIYWYDYNRQNKTWKRYILGIEEPGCCVGCAVLDIDSNGWIDLVSGGVWYKNSGVPGKQFERIVYDENINDAHDIVVGDINSDGRIDILRSNKWFENVNGDGTKWIEHHIREFGSKEISWKENATKCFIADIDKDGYMDIVISEAEINDARIFWLKNINGDGSEWEIHELQKSDPGRRGAYHSLQVMDLDGDGDLDIFSCEMEDLMGDKPPRFYIWENIDGKGKEFREHIILDMNLGGHEAVIGDITGDGKPDICSKCWRASRNNSIGGLMHIDFLENIS